MPMPGDRISADVLLAFAQAIMRARGVDEPQVLVVSGNMIWNDLVGRRNFGLRRLPIHLERVERGLISCPCRPRFEPLGASVERLDGDAGFGQYIAELAMNRAIRLAQSEGVGLVGVWNSNFFGTGAYFVNRAADAGMVGLAMSNSFPKVATHGGTQAVLGTNPLAFGAPRQDRRNLLVDMATSALAGSTVREHLRQRRPLPEGLAVDADGKPITDPEKVGDGALLPFGGAKGAALALLVEIVSGVMTGAGVSHGVASMYGNFSSSGQNGHFLMAIDLSRWMPIETFLERLESLLEILKSSGVDERVRLPGELRWANHDENTRLGIPVDEDLRARLEALARPSAIAAPW
jgi:LDH2 family malate/lactate/ureidoglycolate dehydrogenase